MEVAVACISRTSMEAAPGDVLAAWVMGVEAAAWKQRRGCRRGSGRWTGTGGSQEPRRDWTADSEPDTPRSAPESQTCRRTSCRAPWSLCSCRNSTCDTNNIT